VEGQVGTLWFFLNLFKKNFFLKPDIGLAAINDGLLLDCGINKIIQKEIPSHPRKNAILREIATVSFFLI